MLLIALVVCLDGCSQKKIDELTTAFNAEKESLTAAAQEKLDAVTAEKDELIAKAQEQLVTAKAEANGHTAYRNNSRFTRLDRVSNDGFRLRDEAEFFRRYI